MTLEVMHHFVELLDRYFGNVCELDIIFNFHAAYFLLDEIIIGGHVQETSKKAILKNSHVIDKQEAQKNIETATWGISYRKLDQSERRRYW